MLIHPLPLFTESAYGDWEQIASPSPIRAPAISPGAVINSTTVLMKKTIITVDSAMVKNHPAALAFINAHGGSKNFTVKLTLQNISPSLENELCGEMN